MSNQAANDLIMGGGAPAAKFPAVGSMVRGKITDLTTGQQRDFATQELKTWKDGSPMMQAIITMQTDEHDPDIPNDDGKRRVFVSSKSMREAIRDAIIASGQRELVIGGELAVAYVGDGQPEGNLNPPKLYRAEYGPPALAASSLLGGSPQPAAAPQPAPQAPPPDAQPAAAPAGRSLLG